MKIAHPFENTINELISNSFNLFLFEKSQEVGND